MILFSKFLKKFINKEKICINMKCKICNANIGQTFLNKPLGTYIKDDKGKRHLICSNCQKNNKKEDILTKL